MNVLIIGATGLVGRNVANQLVKENHEVTGTYYRNANAPYSSQQLDKRDLVELENVVTEVDPDVVVDTAAFHAVDDCETQRDHSWSVNAQGTYCAAVASDTVDAHIIYLSTDYVFSGDSNEAPYSEDDPVYPLNYYARTKYAGEQATRVAERSTILRTSVVYGLMSSNFATWVLGELKAGNPVSVVDDQISSPTYSVDLAQACVEVAERELTGLYHATGPSSLSRYEFTLQLAETYGYNTDLIEPISTEELGQEAPRPDDSTLDSSRLYDAIDYEFRTPKEAFEDMKSRF